MSLSDVRDIGAAQALVGKYLLACVDDLPQDFALHDVDALLDRDVIDEAQGLSGRIAEIMLGPANDVWVLDMIDAADGTRYEYLVPVVDEVVLEVPERGAIRIRIPEGMEPELTQEMPDGETHEETKEPADAH